MLTKYENRIKLDTLVFSETVLQISIKFIIEGSVKSWVNLVFGACITQPLVLHVEEIKFYLTKTRPVHKFSRLAWCDKWALLGSATCMSKICVAILLIRHTKYISDCSLWCLVQLVCIMNAQLEETTKKRKNHSSPASFHD